MDYLKLSVDKLSVDAVSELVIDETCGAVSLFVGTTRNNFEGKKVLRLEYEAYEPMALKSMTEICREIRSKWPSVHGIAIYHRLGEVPAREASVIIAISSPHRQDSLQAVSFCIDTLKAKVPIWKKEVYADDEPCWKENRECPSQDPTPAPVVKLEPLEYDKSLVQINVSNEELERRIQSFIERKRDQINLNNIQDFIPSMQKRDGDTAEANEGEEDGCARVRTQFVRRKDSKSHLKMRKVHNEWGPQLARAPIKRESETKPDLTLPSGIAERVIQLERGLNLAPLGKDVYRRLKDAEDRLAELQGLSPEYAGFWNNQFPSVNAIKQEQSVDVLYTADDIARKIEMLESSGTL